jgi:hypothetical protein
MALDLGCLTAAAGGSVICMPVDADMYTPPYPRGISIPVAIVVSLSSPSVRKLIRDWIVGMIDLLAEIRHAWRQFRSGE